MQMIKSTSTKTAKSIPVSPYYDERHTRNTDIKGKGQIVVGVWNNAMRKRKFYKFTPKLFLTREEFNEAVYSHDPDTGVKYSNTQRRKTNKKIIDDFIIKIDKSLDDITDNGKLPFTFEQLNAKLELNGPKNNNDLFSVMRGIIDDKIKAGDIGTASTYETSLKSFKEYHKAESLNINLVNKAWLTAYQKFMIDKGRSYTTVAIYLRNLRAAYNMAIKDNKKSFEAIYPFGQAAHQYAIPTTKKVNKALTVEELKSLFNAEPKNAMQQKAKDFWFLSYACNGMNMVDIARLKYKDIDNDRFTFLRTKTRNTSKEKLNIVVYFNDFIRQVFDTYSNKMISSNTFVFDIINDRMKPDEQIKRVKNFTKFVNQHIKKLAIDNGLNKNISTYWARHSFTNIAVNQRGASMEFIKESLGHHDIKTTFGYFQGIDDKDKKEFGQSSMDLITG